MRASSRANSTNIASTSINGVIAELTVEQRKHFTRTANAADEKRQRLATIKNDNAAKQKRIQLI